MSVRRHSVRPLDVVVAVAAVVVGCRHLGRCSFRYWNIRCCYRSLRSSSAFHATAPAGCRRCNPTVEEERKGKKKSFGASSFCASLHLYSIRSLINIWTRSRPWHAFRIYQQSREGAAAATYPWLMRQMSDCLSYTFRPFQRLRTAPRQSQFQIIFFSFFSFSSSFRLQSGNPNTGAAVRMSSFCRFYGLMRLRRILKCCWPLDDSVLCNRLCAAYSASFKFYRVIARWRLTWRRQ